NQITVQWENEDLHIQYVSRSYPKKMYYIDQQTVIYFRDEKKKYFTMIQSNRKWLLKPESEAVYIDGRQVMGRIAFNVDDAVYCSDFVLILDSHDTLIVKARDDFKLNVPLMKKPTTVMKRKYPNYRRTPRMIYDLPEDKVDFAFPTEERDHGQRGLWLII